MQTIEEGKCCFETQLSEALGITKKEMIDDSGEVWPRALVFLEDNKLEWMAIELSFMDSPSEKNNLAAMLTKTCFRKDVQCIVFMSDVMAGEIPTGVNPRTLPQDMREWPKQYIREALLITVNALGMQGNAVFCPYKRDAENKRVFDSVDYTTTSTSNRFAFDLTHGDITRAMHSALERGIFTMNDRVA